MHTRPITIQAHPWSHAQLWAVPIRYNVFVLEQQVPVTIEMDELDAVSTHYVAFHGHQAIGTARITPDFHIGRVAVQQGWRSSGIGRMLMDAIVKDLGDRDLHLNAQTAVEQFYKKLGFKAHGDTFMEAGIEHISMMRSGHQAA